MRDGETAFGGQTRRQFLGRVGISAFAVSGGGALLAACGGEDAEEAGGGATAAATGAAAPAAIGPVELKYVGWEGYDGAPASTFKAFQRWMSDNEITLTATYVSDNEEMLTKIQASPAGTYDLTSPYHGTVPTMILTGVLEPIDTDKMTNWSAIYPFLQEQDFIRGEDGTIYGVPFTFSQASPLYNADKVEPLESLAAVVDDPALKGRFTLIDAPEHFTWIAQILGLGNPDPHHLTTEELQQCLDYGRQVVANSRTLAPALGDILQLLITGEVDYSLTGTYDQVAKAQAEGVNIQVFHPKEGSQTFVDNYCIPKDAENYDAALAWIDQMLAPEPQAEVAQVYGGGVANPAAVEFLTDELRQKYDYENLDAVFEVSPVFPAIPAESDEFATYADWTEAWAQVK
jgi:spermidine/putrescine transport system substrate-binding protein